MTDTERAAAGRCETYGCALPAGHPDRWCLIDVVSVEVQRVDEDGDER